MIEALAIACIGNVTWWLEMPIQMARKFDIQRHSLSDSLDDCIAEPIPQLVHVIGNRNNKRTRIQHVSGVVLS